MEETRTLEAALRVAQHQLASAERELMAARERVHRLAATVYSLRALLGDQDVNKDQAELFPAQAAKGAARPAGIPSAPSSGRAEGHPQHPLERSPHSSIDRAVAILAEAGRPLRMSELRAEWERRGWVNPTWKAPEAAISMAFHRAKRAGKVGRMLDGSWVLPMIIQDELAQEDQIRPSSEGDDG